MLMLENLFFLLIYFALSRLRHSRRLCIPDLHWLFLSRLAARFRDGRLPHMLHQSISHVSPTRTVWQRSRAEEDILPLRPDRRRSTPPNILLHMAIDPSIDVSLLSS